MSNSNTEGTSLKDKVIQPQFLYAFILVTSLFALWGFANDLTNPLVRAFKEIFQISNTQSSLVQAAFYGGYATMAIPAALVIRKLSFKSGIIIGLILYSIGALLTIPAAGFMQFNIFLVGFYILTFGLAFLETSANPYILSMGSPETATRRLNLAQAFNPIGSLTGMMVAKNFIAPRLGVSKFRAGELASHPEYENMDSSVVDGLLNKALEVFSKTNPEAHMEMVSQDLAVVKFPYVVIALVVLGVMALFIFSKMPDTGKEDEKIELGSLMSHLFGSFHYIGGVVAQTFYVGAQIMCWTFIYHYAMTLCGLTLEEAAFWNLVAMCIFLSSRFICTFILKYLNPGLLLGILSIGGLVLTIGAIFIQGMLGLYCLIGVSACMSLMFPTIYGIALHGLTPNDAKLGSAGLIFAIVGGALMPPLQGKLIDGDGMSLLGMNLESVRVSFFLPVICFVVVAAYGFLSNRIDRKAHPSQA